MQPASLKPVATHSATGICKIIVHFVFDILIKKGHLPKLLFLFYMM